MAKGSVLGDGGGNKCFQNVFPISHTKTSLPTIISYVEQSLRRIVQWVEDALQGGGEQDYQ